MADGFRDGIGAYGIRLDAYRDWINPRTRLSGRRFHPAHLRIGQEGEHRGTYGCQPDAANELEHFEDYTVW